MCLRWADVSGRQLPPNTVLSPHRRRASYGGLQAIVDMEETDSGVELNPAEEVVVRRDDKRKFGEHRLVHSYPDAMIITEDLKDSEKCKENLVEDKDGKVKSLKKPKLWEVELMLTEQTEGEDENDPEYVPPSTCLDISLDYDEVNNIGGIRIELI